MTTATDRLARLLGLVPYLTENQGADLAHTAQVFGISTDQLIDDLQLLFVTGRPGRMPDDLIEASWEDGRVHVGNADEVSVPVRLTGVEATSLLVALDYLISLTPEQADTIRATREKIRAAAGVDDVDAVLEVRVPEIDPGSADLIRDAVARGTGLALDYYVPSRDELTSRLVTPRALRLAGQWYMDAWCHTSVGERSFAVANIRSVVAAEAPAAPPVPRADSAPPERRVTLTLAPEAAWIADELEPLALTHDTHGPGTVTMELRVFSHTWLIRLLLRHGRHVLEVAPPQAADAALQEISRTRAGVDASGFDRD